jgi:hypothetical protein
VRKRKRKRIWSPRGKKKRMGRLGRRMRMRQEEEEERKSGRLGRGNAGRIRVDGRGRKG